MMSLMIEAEGVEQRERVRIEAGEIDLEALLVAWLSEILFRVEAEGWAFGDFQVDEISDTSVSGSGIGERLDPEKHGVKMEIKAATYHMLEVGEKDGHWSAQVIFDV